MWTLWKLVRLRAVAGLQPPQADLQRKRLCLSVHHGGGDVGETLVPHGAADHLLERHQVLHRALQPVQEVQVLCRGEG